MGKVSRGKLLIRIINHTFDAQICKEKERAQPGDPRLEGSPGAGATVLVLSRVLRAVDCAGLLPKGNSKAGPLKHGYPDLKSCEPWALFFTPRVVSHHQVVVVIPRQLRLDDHGRRDERRDEGADRVKRMQEALYGVCLVHDANPGAKAGVCQAVAKPTDRVGYDEHGVGRVEC